MKDPSGKDPQCTVEVTSLEPGFRGSWHIATLIEDTLDALLSQSKNVNGSTHVEFTTFEDEDGQKLKERVAWHLVRPMPPATTANSQKQLQCLKEGDTVDAFFEESWWEGVVQRIEKRKKKMGYIVYFPAEPDERWFSTDELRPGMDWDYNVRKWDKRKSAMMLQNSAKRKMPAKSADARKRVATPNQPTVGSKSMAETAPLPAKKQFTNQAKLNQKSGPQTSQSDGRQNPTISISEVSKEFILLSWHYSSSTPYNDNVWVGLYPVDSLGNFQDSFVRYRMIKKNVSYGQARFTASDFARLEAGMYVFALMAFQGKKKCATTGTLQCADSSIYMVGKPGKSMPILQDDGYAIASHMELDSPNESEDRPRKLTKWSEEEDSSLEAHIHQYGPREWKLLSLQLPGRKPRHCRDRWWNHIEPGVKANNWKSEEDYKILEMVSNGSDWDVITSQLVDRTVEAVKRRWNYLQRVRTKQQEFMMRKAGGTKDINEDFDMGDHEDDDARAGGFNEGQEKQMMMSPLEDLLDPPHQVTNGEATYNVHYRWATKEDALVITNLLNDCGKEWTMMYPTQVAVDGVLDNFERGQVLLAETQDATTEVVGCVFIRNSSPGCISKYWGLLAVKEQIRGCGIGTSLMSHVEKVAKSHGCLRTQVLTLNVRPSHVDWYCKHRYVVTGSRSWADIMGSNQNLKEEFWDKALVLEMEKDLCSVPQQYA